jgi:hypothetical protein
MAKMVNWNTAAFEAACVNVSMDRLETAAHIIANDAKRILQSKIKGPPVTRHGQKEVWMERDPGALIDTIRVVRKKGDPGRNIWIMAGNYKTWWALQTEYGRAGWKGGAKSFLRPAMNNAPSRIKGVLESGHGETEGY